MAKIEKLTPEQEALIPVYRQKWLDKFFSLPRIDKEKAEGYLTKLYEKAGYKKPVFWYCDSPFAAQVVANALKANIGANISDNIWDNIWDNIRANIWANIWDNISDNIWDNIRANIWANISANISANIKDNIWTNIRDNISDNISANISDNIRDNIWDNISANISANIWDNIWDNIRANIWANIWDKKLEYFTFGSWAGGWMAYYLGWIDYYYAVLLPSTEESRFFDGAFDGGIYDTLQFDGLCIICANPKFIHQDDNDIPRLHSLAGPAIAWADGYEEYYLWGVHFKKDLWEQITKKTLPIKEVLSLENMEQRMAALKVYGAESCLEGAKAKLLERSMRGNELYVLKDLFSKPQYALKYKCPSTDRVYVSFVPPEIGIDGKADRAMAWKFGLEEKEYESLRVEA